MRDEKECSNVKNMDGCAKSSPVDDLFLQAKAEVDIEVMEKYKDKLKAKLKEKYAAELIVANIERELEELRLRIFQEIG